MTAHSQTTPQLQQKRKMPYTIDSFFTPKAKKPATPDGAHEVLLHPLPNDSIIATPTTIATDTHYCSAPSEKTLVHNDEVEKTIVVPTYDIGNFVENKPDDHTMCKLLEDHWVPPNGYTFPYSEHNKRGKKEKRYLGHHHLSDARYKNWLVFSEVKKGLFCKYCPLLVSGMGGFQKNVPLQKLVTKPLSSFAKLLGKTGDLEIHQASDYHRGAVLSADNFLRSYHDPKKDVVNQLSSHRVEKIEENRKRLEPIVDTIIFLGQQNIPLRGHRDHGELDLNSDVTVNEGNFRDLLRFHVKSGDKVLEEHLKTTSSSATYISKRTQNELIECCGKEILAVIKERIEKAHFYSVIFDETTDLAHISQMSLVIRYVHDGDVREDFIKFIDARANFPEGSVSEESKDVHDTEQALTGKVLGEIVVAALNNISLEIKNCIGIGTDGCSLMISEACGAVKEIRASAEYAVRCPCFNHALNLSLSKSSTVRCVRNANATLQEIVSFFTASSKRNAILKKHVGGQLPGLCETRWIERHTAFLQFRSALPGIVHSLQSISQWAEAQSSSKAARLLYALSDSEFIVTVVSLCDVLSLTLCFSRLLQKPSMDIQCATDILSDTINTLSEKRTKSEEHFEVLFNKATEIADNIEVTITIPRITKRQTHRANLPTSDPQTYYRQAVYIPILEAVVEDLKSRFPPETLALFDLTVLMPKYLLSAETTDKTVRQQVYSIAKRYSNLLHSDVSTIQAMLFGEIQMWKSSWERRKEKKDEEIFLTALETFNYCNSDIYPTIKKLLQILVTLPISVASSERSFQTLRRLKTWLRTRMGEERLTGLALLHIHRDVRVDRMKVIDRFARSGNRRKEFLV